VVKSMQYSTLDKSHECAGRGDIMKGFQLVVDGLLKEQNYALAKCFAVVGIGGEEAEEFSKQQAREVFGGKYSTIQWVDAWHRIPSHWLISQEEELEAELKEAVDKITKKS